MKGGEGVLANADQIPVSMIAAAPVRSAVVGRLIRVISYFP